MRDFVDFIKTHNVWLASVSRALLAVLAAFAFEFTAQQMAMLIALIEVVFGTGQAKMNVAEPRVDLVAERRAVDIMGSPDLLRSAVAKREAASARASEQR